ncbi:MAG: hypothetical protein RIE59_06250 [Imperialibacter sp.]
MFRLYSCLMPPVDVINYSRFESGVAVEPVVVSSAELGEITEAATTYLSETQPHLAKYDN